MKLSKPFFYVTKTGLKVGARAKVGPVGFRISKRGATPYISLRRLFK
jgi:hypothetical protein